MSNASFMSRYGDRLAANGYSILPLQPGAKKPGRFVRGEWRDYPDWTRHAERATTDPQVFTRIHVHFTVRGQGLRRSVVERAIQLSAEKYCSALAMLARTATITHDLELIDEASS